MGDREGLGKKGNRGDGRDGVGEHGKERERRGVKEGREGEDRSGGGKKEETDGGGGQKKDLHHMSSRILKM